MRLFSRQKKKLEDVYDINAIIDETMNKKPDEEDEEFDRNGIENVLSRVEGGLIGSLRIEDDMNFPLIKKGDICHLRAPQRVLKKDFVLYNDHGEYYLRRIIKYKDDGIYVAGDNERAYHRIEKKDIVAKAIGRERKDIYQSLNLHQVSSLYTFIKSKLNFIRLGNRVIEYEEEQNNESLETAMQAIQQQEEIKDFKSDYYSKAEIETDLSSFTNPTELANKYLEEHQNELYEEIKVDEPIINLIQVKENDDVREDEPLNEEENKSEDETDTPVVEEEAPADDDQNTDSEALEDEEKESLEEDNPQDEAETDSNDEFDNQNEEELDKIDDQDGENEVKEEINPDDLNSQDEDTKGQE